MDRTPGRSYYEDHIENFVEKGEPKAIVDYLLETAEEDDEHIDSQKDAWVNQIRILKRTLVGKEGYIIFEYKILRLNARIDVVLLMDGIVYSLEFKNNETEFLPEHIDQADGYGYALKNFHAASKDRLVVPLLIATRAPDYACSKSSDLGIDGLFTLFMANPKKMTEYIDLVGEKYGGKQAFTEEEFHDWIRSPFKANPTIIDSARAIYANNKVADFWMFDAGEDNLRVTEKTVDEIIAEAQTEKKKIICFVTGVPGAGKTLVGLDIAGKSLHGESKDGRKAVFFSGNGPLVNVLTTQLGLDAMRQFPDRYPSKSRAITDMKSFIQDLHAFKTDIISSSNPVPEENVLIFDEAQRVWDEERMKTWFANKKTHFPTMHLSEADLLMSVLKEKEWAVIIALVGLGQDIHDGENGIRTWFDSLLSKNKEWEIRLSNELFEQNADQLGDLKETLLSLPQVKTNDGLHLKVSLRTPRAKNMALFTEAVLENKPLDARKALEGFDQYPIYLTRDLEEAKRWVTTNRRRKKERCGALYSTNGKSFRKTFRQLSRFYVAEWFIDQEGDNSSNALTYMASEFDVQGLELDWVLLNWDMDMFYGNGEWHQQKVLSKKRFVESTEIEKKHILNSYRVLMTRARKGLVIYLPEINPINDFYEIGGYFDSTYEFLKKCGLKDLKEDGPARYKPKAIELPF